MTYAQFTDAHQLLIVLFVAVVAPELVSRDLRSGVLPLYFSRPLRRADYALAKCGAGDRGLAAARRCRTADVRRCRVLHRDGLVRGLERAGRSAAGLAYVGLLHALVFAVDRAAGRARCRRRRVRRRRRSWRCSW